jgi:hypothetical protein
VIKHFSGWAVGVGLGGLVKCGDARTGFPLWLIYLCGADSCDVFELAQISGHDGDGCAWIGVQVVLACVEQPRIWMTI